LDGLRASAALLVLLFHSHTPGFANGRDGVTIFFVLSGYLITSILRSSAETNGIDVIGFWGRRMRRLYPALALVVGVTTAAGFATHRPEWSSDALLALGYVMNIAALGGRAFTPLFHTWTLAIEMQFYLVWPFILPALSKTGRPAAILAAVWFALAALNFALWPQGDRVAYYFPTAAASALVAGALVAYLPTASTNLGALGAALMFTALFLPAEYGGAFARRAPVLIVGSAIFISSLRNPSSLLGKLMSIEPLPSLGLISYCFYLWHYPILSWIAPAPWTVRLAVAGGVGLAMAALSYQLVERRFMSGRSAPAHLDYQPATQAEPLLKTGHPVEPPPVTEKVTV
jgi:peptidoglycan/LPS O-acetylase OafA/YrhL